MGNFCGKFEEEPGGLGKEVGNGTTGQKFVPVKAFKLDNPVTKSELLKMREEFWDTQPHYGGQREIWDALKAAIEGDAGMRGIILESAGIIVSNPDLTLFYDERGVKYELPNYIVGFPSNMLKEAKAEVELASGPAQRI